VTDTDTAILGGGPAGAAAAIALARAGRRALLLERDAAPREAVCGEFLGPDAAAALARLGLDLPALGAAPLRRLRLGAGRREAALDLPFPAWALPRRALDAALRAAARDAGAEVAAGAAVRGAAPSGEGWRLRLHGGAEVAARRAVLATGKHALRGWPRAPAPPGALGLKLHLSGVEPGPEVVLLRFAGGYAGLLPLPEGEGGGANLCAALQDGAPPGGAARDPAALLARVAEGSALGARLLRGARPRWDRPLAVGAVPYGFRHGGGGGAGGPAGLFRVGDQVGVVPSFTGDGVAMALLSGLAAAEAIAAGGDAPRFHAEWRRRSAGPMRWAGLGAWAMRRVPRGFVAGTALVPGVARALARRTRMEGAAASLADRRPPPP
jgi:flavin-dependent dehydrogenase